MLCHADGAASETLAGQHFNLDSANNAKSRWHFWTLVGRAIRLWDQVQSIHSIHALMFIFLASAIFLRVTHSWLPLTIARMSVYASASSFGSHRRTLCVHTLDYCRHRFHRRPSSFKRRASNRKKIMQISTQKAVKRFYCAWNIKIVCAIC